jgi:SAM-dependent methyltransferase
MRIAEGIKYQGRPFEIPDCSRDELPQFFVEMGYKVGAEIGVSKGRFSVKFASQGLTLYAIDPWKVYNDYNDARGQTFYNSLYQQAQKSLAPYTTCKIIKKPSMEAVLDFADNSLDFVYIDGNHEFKYVAEDVSEWSKKVREGGVISGHDYAYIRLHCHVIPVVNAYTQAYNITNWYLLGRKTTLAGEKRDNLRSWMWIKK